MDKWNQKCMKQQYAVDIKIGIGEGVVARAPNIISSAGIGSCVVVMLYDSKMKIGAAAHIMLPEIANLRGNLRISSYQYADTAIFAQLEDMEKEGAMLKDITARMVGGARMFPDFEEHNNQACIGVQNIEYIKKILLIKRIPVVGEDTGGSHGRSVEFHLDTGKVVVKFM